MASRRGVHMSFSVSSLSCISFFFFNDTATTEIYTLSLHDALPIFQKDTPEVRGTRLVRTADFAITLPVRTNLVRSEEHTSELQSRLHLVCRLLLEKKKKKKRKDTSLITMRLGNMPSALLHTRRQLP